MTRLSISGFPRHASFPNLWLCPVPRVPRDLQVHSPSLFADLLALEIHPWGFPKSLGYPNRWMVYFSHK